MRKKNMLSFGGNVKYIEWMQRKKEMVEKKEWNLNYMNGMLSMSISTSSSSSRRFSSYAS